MTALAVFFAGLVGIDAVLLAAQAATTTLGVGLSARDRALLVVNASIVAARAPGVAVNA